MSDTEFYNSLSPIEQGIVDFYRTGPAGAIAEFHTKFLEIGSGWGIFTRTILMTNKNARVVTIDKIPEPRSFSKNTAGYESRIDRYVGDSKQILPKFPDKSADVVFIDGDHGYHGFKADFKESWRIVRDGGWIICDDVTHKKNFENDYGIIKALSELVHEYKFTVEIFPVAHGIAIIKKI